MPSPASALMCRLHKRLVANRNVCDVFSFSQFATNFYTDLKVRGHTKDLETTALQLVSTQAITRKQDPHAGIYMYFYRL
jgi:hypothetical protein